MSAPRLTRLAAAELVGAAGWIARDNPGAARRFRAAVEQALDRLGRFPASGVARPELAADPIRFWFLQRFPYALIYDSARRPPLVLHVVHAAHDLPALLRDARR